MAENLNKWLKGNSLDLTKRLYNVSKIEDLLRASISSEWIKVISIHSFGVFCFKQAKESIYFEEEKEHWLAWGKLSKKEKRKILKEIVEEAPDGNVSWLFLADCFLDSGLLSYLKKLEEEGAK